MGKSNQLLSEVVFIRPMLIVMLIVYHAFIIYQGGWAAPDGFIPSKAYWWISKLSYSFMLEGFVFISGYVFAYQLNKNPYKYERLTNVVKDKGLRLIIPSIVFSAIYFVLFYDYTSIANTIYTILDGAGHMWYLPMLFWCFIGYWFLSKCEIKTGITLFMLILMALASSIPLPIRINSAMYYLLFFYLGALVYGYRDRVVNYISTHKIIVSWIVFATVFVGLTLASVEVDSLSDNGGIVLKALCTSTTKAMRILYATLGIAATYMTFAHWANHHSPSKWIIKFGTISMGVYILQQFILQTLYYKTSLPILVGSYWLPWVSAISTLLLSIVGAYALKKCPLTKHLI